MSTIGGHDYALESNAYTDGPAKMDVGDTDGNIYYRILLYNFGDEISLQDTMWSKKEGWQGRGFVRKSSPLCFCNRPE